MDPLPEYKYPPVIEVVCGVQFDPLPGFQSVHLGQFWQRVRDHYPKAEDRAPLSDVREMDEGTTAGAELLAELPPLRRVFCVDATGNFLLQVQPSRFLSNWRKERPSDDYPRYTVALGRFREGWHTFVAFVREGSLGALSTNQYELTYINHIPEEGEPYPVGIERYLPVFAWKSAQSLPFLPAPRAASMRLQFALPEGKGRLHVTVNHGRPRDDGKGLLVLDLTARGPARPDWSDMEDWFAMAHEWIVRGFTDLTSPAAHRAWNRVR